MPLPGLKRWRLRRGLSLTELARRAELKDGYIARIESGRRGCNPEGPSYWPTCSRPTCGT